MATQNARVLEHTELAGRRIWDGRRHIVDRQTLAQPCGCYDNDEQMAQRLFSKRSKSLLVFAIRRVHEDRNTVRAKPSTVVK